MITFIGNCNFQYHCHFVVIFEVGVGEREMGEFAGYV